MNRLIKWSVILGIMVSLVGIGVITAGAMMGGGYYMEWVLREAVREGWDYGRRSMRNSRFYEDWEALEEKGNLEGTYNLAVPEEIMGPEEILTLDENSVREQLESGEISIQNTMNYEQVRELEVEVFGNVLLQESEDLTDGQVRIEIVGDGENYQYRQKRDKLEIKPTVSMYTDHYQENTIILSLPVGTYLNEVEVNARAGAFFADRLLAKEISLQAEAGTVAVKQIQTEELSLDVKAGSVQCGGAVTREVSAECNLGEIQLTLEGKKEDYSYEMECDMGTIFLGGEIPEEYPYQGVHWEKDMINPNGKKVELECKAGSISVNFSES